MFAFLVWNSYLDEHGDFVNGDASVFYKIAEALNMFGMEEDLATTIMDDSYHDVLYLRGETPLPGGRKL